MTLDAEGPNAQQIEYWNQVAGPKWVAFEEQLDAQLEPLERHAARAAGFEAGEQVVDVGCGCGASTLRVARAVGPSGGVLGVDVSAVMLERARRRAEAAEAGHVRFANADAQTFAFERGRFDVVFSRFGVMFFADPEAAFANLRSALRPGGRLTFLCWQALDKNPWMSVVVAAALRHLPPPDPPPPGAPGPFAFADAGRVAGILARAGLGEIAFEPLHQRLAVGGGGGLDEAVGFALQLGPLGRLLRDVPEATRQRVADAVREALEPHAGPEGVHLDSAAWIARARRPR